MENQSTYHSLALPNLQSRTIPTSSQTFDTPPLSVRFKIRFQSWMGHVFLFPFCGLIVFLMRAVRGYRIENLDEIRKKFRVLIDDERPLLICANHLTFIDSALMLWAMSPNYRYFFRYRSFSWNLPAGDFFKKKLIFRIVAYLTKCIFIHRDGSKDHKNSILELCHYLLSRGELVTIFPEGKRSRIGRFDRERLVFGAGKIIANLPECRVLCVYLRSDKQATFSNYPAKNSRFRLLSEVISPSSEKQGREAYREIVEQVASTISRLEDEYFAGRY